MWDSEVFKLLTTEKMRQMLHEVQQDQLVRRATARLPRRTASAAHSSKLAARGVWATLAYLMVRLARTLISGHLRALSQPVQRR